MSICQSGINCKVKPTKVLVNITQSHPLIQLAQTLPWNELFELILPDLKIIKSASWWLGRKLKVRIHLGVYILQQIFNKTDREMEYGVKDNAAYQLFCGYGVVDKWHAPDHTKIEEFRSRLTSETQQRFADYLNNKLFALKIKPMEVNLKGIKSMARRYFFLKKNATQEEKDDKLSMLLDYVRKEVKLVINNSLCMGENFIKEMPWNIRKIFYQLVEKAEKYLNDVKQFLQTHDMVPDKILSFHLNQVRCFTKNKPGKKYQFGRVFQLARIKGNFIFSGKCESPNTSDKSSIQLLLNSHRDAFNNVLIKSASADKGYYSQKNEEIMAQHGIDEIGIQRPSNIKKDRIKTLVPYREGELINRRAGIEPLIGHVKHKGQLGRSRMKSDRTIEASGFSAILGFNLRQLMRYKIGKTTLEAT